uniref:DUF5641 domain-containing protein n=1 Tax=Anopheles dirus TaxID=7168 RepID=A0A182NN02_9DIPT
MKRRQETERKRVELELQLKFVKEEEEILADELGVMPMSKASTENRDPTPQHGGQRNVPTELPVFSGDPADWPVFIAHYEYTSKNCGLSNWENMVRLQKALKGPALEAVRSRLLLPEVVPQVIATLRSRYGRPEHLISALIEKSVRTVPRLNLSRQSFVCDEGKWEHLKRLPILEYRDAEPKILIGLDNLRLAVPLKTREGSAGEPIATTSMKRFECFTTWNVGLDYFGPVLVKRGRSNEKRWVALFTCLTIRAIHLEVVSSLSTESCDNGTNFLGASRQLRKEIDERNEVLAATFTNAHTRWSFNPPGAPHMGGVWERMVRSVKAAISTVMEVKNTPDDETLETVLCDAEAMINSRPLTSSGIKQQPALPTNYRDSLKGNWKLTQHILDGIWRRWIKEYLPVIRRQGKWFENVREIKVGDLVLVVDGAVRSHWKKGIVERTIPGADGRVRQVWVRTTTGTLRRPVAKLALLDVAA